jgi:hypothetical protein
MKEVEEETRIVECGLGSEKIDEKPANRLTCNARVALPSKSLLVVVPLVSLDDAFAKT